MISQFWLCIAELRPFVANHRVTRASVTFGGLSGSHHHDSSQPKISPTPGSASQESEARVVGEAEEIKGKLKELKSRDDDSRIKQLENKIQQLTKCSQGHTTVVRICCTIEWEPDITCTWEACMNSQHNALSYSTQLMSTFAITILCPTEIVPSAPWCPGDRGADLGSTSVIRWLVHWYSLLYTGSMAGVRYVCDPFDFWANRDPSVAADRLTTFTLYVHVYSCVKQMV